MSPTESQPPKLVSFGVFELDLVSGDLRKQGRRVRLQEQPFRILKLLVLRPGQLIPREDIREALWPDGISVDFDHSVNKAVNKLRETLGDSADSPRFIETLPRRGYRFVCPVVGASSADAVAPAPGPTLAAVGAVPDEAAEKSEREAKSEREEMARPAPVPAESDGDRDRRAGTERPGSWRVVLAAAAIIAAVAGLATVWRSGDVPRQTGRVMLVVLPFRGVPESPDQDYFVDGLTEEMIAQVGRVRPDRLGVIAATSAQRYKGTAKPAGEIARELSVDYLLEGSVRRDAGRVRITGQLVKATDQAQVWSETFERDLEDVFDIQRDVAERIAQALALELVDDRPALIGATTRVAAAHEHYLQGRFAYAQRTRESLLASVDDFKRASAEDPSFALAYVGVADAYNLMAEYGYVAPSVAFPVSKAAAERALELSPDLAEAHANLAWAAYIYDRDFAAAETGFLRSISLNPGYASTHQWYAGLLRAQARHDEADEQIRRAQELDPVSPIIQSVAGWHDYLARRFESSVERCMRTAQAFPNFPRVYSYLGWSYLKTGRPTEAVAAFERALALSGDSVARRAELAHGYASVGRTGEARALLDRLLADESRDYVEPDLIARVYAALGETDRALEWLTKGVDQRAVKLVLAGVDPVYDVLRGDPRYAALLRAISLDPGRYGAR